MTPWPILAAYKDEMLLRSLFFAALLAAAPPDLEAIVRDRAAAHGVSGDYLSSVAGCESKWNQYAVGALGELGLFQLHPRGELRAFWARGFTDPFDAWQSSEFAAQRFAEGGASAWSCS